MEITPQNVKRLFKSHGIPIGTKVHVQKGCEGRMIEGKVVDCRSYPDVIMIAIRDQRYLESPPHPGTTSSAALKLILDRLGDHEPDLRDKIVELVGTPVVLAEVESYDTIKDKIMLPNPSLRQLALETALRKFPRELEQSSHPAVIAMLEPPN